MFNFWLKQCVNDHETCSKSLDNKGPTRLLDLMAPSNDQDLRLVIVEDVGKQPYAALSYNWGENAELKLSTENYNDFRSRIPYHHFHGQCKMP
jgi:hypothetical protein